MTTKGSVEKKTLPFRYQFGAGAMAGISEVRNIFEEGGYDSADEMW
jgi:hypothetical protein